MRGTVDCFVFFFIHIQSRRVYVAGMTTNPTQAWVAEQGQNFCRHAAQQSVKPTHLIRDFDGKFGTEFDATLAAQDIKVVKVGPRRPLMNCYAERWVGTVRQQCVHHFVVLGERHLCYLVAEFTHHYNLDRPHQGVGNVPLSPSNSPPSPDTASTKDIDSRQRLGGLLKHYHQRAA
jgi:putative transposase